MRTLAFKFLPTRSPLDSPSPDSLSQEALAAIGVERSMASAARMSAGAEAACEQERVHIPGSIQPHGAFLAISPFGSLFGSSFDSPGGNPGGELAVVAASRNAAEMLATAPAGGTVLGRSAASVLGRGFAEAVRTRFQDGRLQGESPWQSTLRLDDPSLVFDVAVHSHAGLIHVELERAGAQGAAAAQAAIRQLQDAIFELREAGNELEELARVAARGVRLLTGYERVLIYRFDTDWNGQAVAEDKAVDWDLSLGGVRFPASDIPAQARELYRRNPMRWVADRDAVPVPLDIDSAWTGDRSPQAVDLSFAYLRSLSPVHLQVHRDLGINGSMSLSIMHKERLWGLMVCHHRQPHHPSSCQRSAAAALTNAFALRIGPAEHTSMEQARREDLVRLSALLAQMAEADVVSTALTTGEVTIGSLFASTGAAVLYDGDVSLVGHTPPEADVRELAVWLWTHHRGAKLFQTSSIAAAYPSWTRHMAVASGVLAVFLSAGRSDMLLWFRPEEAELVSWGSGSQVRKPDPASTRPQPSLERWVEARRGVAQPWAEWQTEMAETLRHGITEVMVRSLRRIADLTEKLRQSQKMEAVGQLTGGISHDFNNLLTGIIGSMDLLRTRLAQGRLGEVDRFIDVAMACANRAASLTHRLLSFSRQQTLDPRPIDVNHLTASMEDLIRRTIGPAIHLQTVLSGDLWKTHCDANQLENALLNLAINARDAMPDGGRLTIKASNAHLDDTYASRHPEVAAGQYVSVSVTDTGTGMAPELIARVFEPFFTTKPAGQGTGLGLSMVYGFARQSDGHAAIDSTVGRGTTVRIYLPRYLGQGDVEASEPEPPSDPAAEAGETVLVVDDEPVLRLLLGVVLRDLGYGAIEAADAAEGLRVLQSERRIDLLVTDVGLPGGMNGRQLAHAARVHRPGLKVLFITGFAESAALGNDAPAPDTQVVTKPFAMDSLAAKIRAMI